MGELDRRDFIATVAAAACAAQTVSGTPPPSSDAGEPKETLAFRRDIPIRGSYDIVVCGGGPSGLAAALAARRAGASVLLVEGMGQLGGMGVSGLVSHWLGGRTTDCRRRSYCIQHTIRVESALRSGHNSVGCKEIRLCMGPSESSAPSGATSQEIASFSADLRC